MRVAYLLVSDHNSIFAKGSRTSRDDPKYIFNARDANRKEWEDQYTSVQHKQSGRSLRDAVNGARAAEEARKRQADMVHKKLGAAARVTKAAKHAAKQRAKAASVEAAAIASRGPFAAVSKRERAQASAFVPTRWRGAASLAHSLSDAFVGAGAKEGGGGGGGGGDVADEGAGAAWWQTAGDPADDAEHNAHTAAFQPKPKPRTKLPAVESPANGSPAKSPSGRVSMKLQKSMHRKHLPGLPPYGSPSPSPGRTGAGAGAGARQTDAADETLRSMDATLSPSRTLVKGSPGVPAAGPPQ